MPVLKMVAAEQLRLLVADLIVGNAFGPVPASHDPDNACGRDHHMRLVVSHRLLPLIACAAAMLLFSVRMTVDPKVDEDDDDDAEVSVGRKRRVVLLIAICLAAACSVLAVSTFEDGHRYRNGCAAPTETGWSLPALLVLVGVVLPAQGFFAWTTLFEH